MQKVDYVSIRDAMIGILAGANTTTATIDLSLSLTVRVVDVSARDPNVVPLMQSEYPYVFVQLLNKTAEHQEFGSGRISDTIEINGSAYCIFDSGTPATADDDVLRLARNVESNIHNNRTLGSYSTAGCTIYDTLCGNTELKEVFRGGDSAYNRGARVDFTIFAHVEDI
jgi:hypothetical protein